MAERWTLKWPTEPGFYLFYGGFEGEHPKMQLCEMWVTGRDGRAYAAGGQFLHEGEHKGAWRPFDEKPPDLEALKRGDTGG